MKNKNAVQRNYYWVKWSSESSSFLTYRMRSSLTVYPLISSCPDLSVQTIAPILCPQTPSGLRVIVMTMRKQQPLRYNIITCSSSAQVCKRTVFQCGWRPCDVCASPHCEILNVSLSVRSHGRCDFHGSSGRNVIL